MFAPLLAVAGLLLLQGVTAFEDELTQCALPPKWTVKGKNPLEEARKSGNMTVVAFLDAKCGFCMLQAKLLQRLKNKFEKKGIKGITYMIVNKRSAASMISRYNGLVDFPVHQDQTGAIWQSMKGGKDDFFLFDRCGRLAYYLHHSVTYLGWPYVSNAILYTHQNKHPCKGACAKVDEIGTPK